MTKESLRVLDLPNPIRRYCHESFCEDHNRLVVGERDFEDQTCCRKFGPAGRAVAGASTHPAESASLGIVLVKASTGTKVKREASAKWAETRKAHPPTEWNTQWHALPLKTQYNMQGVRGHCFCLQTLNVY